jgi:hypothetical protein
MFGVGRGGRSFSGGRRGGGVETGGRLLGRCRRFLEERRGEHELASRCSFLGGEGGKGEGGSLTLNVTDFSKDPLDPF